MTTPLKKPFNNDFTNVENLVCALLIARKEFDESNPRHQAIRNAIDIRRTMERNDRAEAHLKAEGIDYRTWNPPAPLLVAGHEATFNSDGSIKVGCQTIPKETMELVVKRWQEAKQEPEWPKWCRNGNRDSRSIIEFHQDRSKSIWHFCDGSKQPVNNYDSYEQAIACGLTPITATEAARILGKEQKEEWPRYASDHNSVYSFKSYSVGRRFSIKDDKWMLYNWRISECENFVGFKFITREQAEALIGNKALTSPE